MSFIHFGCWNNGFCNKNYNSRSALNSNSISNFTKVSKKLRNNVNSSRNDLKFIVIAGDNYYPDKFKNKNSGEKIKSIIVENLLSGFKCLPQDIDTFLLLGNQDVENIQQIIYEKTLQNNNSIIITNNGHPYNLEKECFIYNFQKMYSEYKRYIHFVSNKIEHQIINNTLIIMIDSNLYDFNNDKYLKCYQKIHQNRNNLNKSILINELIRYQYNNVIELIKSSTQQNIIIIGHHPIFSVKLKKNENVSILLDKMLELFEIPGKNYYYLCADTHLYQHGIINYQDIHIEQYICGTGGAEKNKSPNMSNNENRFLLNNVEYIIEESSEINGYLHIDCNNDNPEFNFIAI
jgi:hypothetical protein